MINVFWANVSYKLVPTGKLFSQLSAKKMKDYYSTRIQGLMIMKIMLIEHCAVYFSNDLALLKPGCASS